MFGYPEIDFSDPTFVLFFVGLIVALFLAFGVGANDVANSFGTSVGAKVLSLRQACILATICEISGAVLIGYKVSETVRKGIFDVHMYEDDLELLMKGFLSALVGSACWNILATFFSLPISGTHSIVGAVVGFSLVAKGLSGLNLYGLGRIVLSWFISPVLSGVGSALIFYTIKRCILNKRNPLEAGLKSLPLFYAFTVFVNVISILLDGPEVLYFHLIPPWVAFVSSAVFAIVVAIIVCTIIAPRLRAKIIAKVLSPMIGEKNGSVTKESISFDTVHVNIDQNQETITSINSIQSTCSSTVSPPIRNFTTQPPLLYHPQVSFSPETEERLALPNRRKRCRKGCDRCKRRSLASFEVAMLEPRNGDEPQKPEEPPEAAELFSFLQILTAIFGSFAHGGNDVSNAIGPLVALYLIWAEKSVKDAAETPIWILLYGGIGISIGLWVWGRKVIQTIGEDLTKVTPSNGFSIEIGAASTVLLASKIGFPISTTHCKVGSIVFVGWVKSTSAVDWKLFRGIVAAWVFTLPIAGGLSAAFMALLMRFT